jgi:pseudouridine-5'-phosphate glycosidase
MESTDLIIVAKQVLIDQSIVPATIYVKDGKVSSIKEHHEIADAANVMKVPGTNKVHVVIKSRPMCPFAWSC